MSSSLVGSEMCIRDSCYVSPYKAEGFNLTPLEAAACGTQIVVTNGGSSDDYFDDCMGFKIESKEKNLNNNILVCDELKDINTLRKRKKEWEEVRDKNNGIHPSVGIANTRLLNKMRCSAVPAIYGAGMHPNQSVWVYEERTPEPTFFKPVNRFRK